MRNSIFVLTLALLASAAMAQVSFDFDNVTITDLEAAGWVFTDGSNAVDTIIIDTTITHNSSAGALRLNIRDLAKFPLGGQYGTLDLWVYDFGYIINDQVNGGTCYGPTWGLQKIATGDWTYPEGETKTYNYTRGIGAGLCNKSFLSSDGGFAWEPGTSGSMTTILQDIVDQDVIDGDPLTYTQENIDESQTYEGWGHQSWFGPTWFGGGSSANNFLRVEGWNHFQISYKADGQIEVILVENADGTRAITQTRDATDPADTANYGPFEGDGTGVNNLFIYGGSTSMGEYTIGGVVYDETWFGDVLIDDLSWTPEEGDFIDGDANGDGVVNLDDFIILKQNYGAGSTWAQGDFNGDGAVNLDDFIILKQNYGNTAP